MTAAVLSAQNHLLSSHECLCQVKSQSRGSPLPPYYAIMLVCETEHLGYKIEKQISWLDGKVVTQDRDMMETSGTSATFSNPSRL